MKICIIGPGMMPIPPSGWGAIEILIDDYRKCLESLGHEVLIVNTKDMQLAAFIANSMNPDFVHIQYDDYIGIAQKLNCKNIGITSHYAYIEKKERWNKDYSNFFKKTCVSNIDIICLSERIANVYIDACVPERNVHVCRNGVNFDLFDFNPECSRPNDTIYLAKIDKRKSQYKYKHIDNLWFYGGIADDRFPEWHPRYLGEISKNNLYSTLTEWSNLALLSDGEAHPLVCMEAMAAGLGLVISESATANLDLEMPFIDVIPDERLNDLDYVSSVLSKNRKKSVSMRQEIREYGKKFSWDSTIKNIYIPTVQGIVSKNGSS